jgi:hypothetical protein
MDSEKINELLNKYWNCETTLEEEQQLQVYFRSSSVPDSLKETAALFTYFDRRRKKNLTDVSFDARVRKALRKPKGQLMTLAYNSMRIAAGVIVLVVAIWLVRMEVRKTSPLPETADTYNDPKLAFEETKKALMMISKSFSTAEEQAKKINLFNEAQKDLQKDTNKVEL